MSNDSVQHEEPSLSRKTRNFIGFAGCLLVFLFILFVAYLPNRPEPVNQEIIEERTQRLDETRRAAQSQMGQYGVINRAEGVYQIPVERAQRILVEELRSRKQMSEEGHSTQDEASQANDSETD